MNEDKNSKLQKIITTSKDLFWKFGMRRVSIEEICKEACVSKMTFYKHFKNKNDLVKHLLDKISEEGVSKYKEIMNRDVSFHEKVRLSIQLKMDGTQNLSQEFFLDLHKNADPNILAHFNQMMQKNIQLVLKDYIDAQKRGDIRSDIKPEFILYFLSQMVKMAEDNALSKFYESPQAVIMELMNFFFYGVLPRDKE